MNDLTPPPRRPIPPHERAAMRDRLRRELDANGAAIAGRGSRLLVPAIAAAATLAVVAVGGYASVTGGDGARSAGFASDGTTEPQPPESTEDCMLGQAVPEGEWRDDLELHAAPEVEIRPGPRSRLQDGPVQMPELQKLEEFQLPDDSGEVGPAEEQGHGAEEWEAVPPDSGMGMVCEAVPGEGEGGIALGDPGKPSSTIVADPSRLYERCGELVAEKFPNAGTTTGRLAVETGPARTVVVSGAEDERAFVCHLTPQTESVAPAEDGLQISGREAWAGGPVPKGADGLGYAFEHGDETAVVSDGWWAVQTEGPDPITEPPMRWLYAVTEGSLTGEGTICDEAEPDC